MNLQTVLHAMKEKLLVYIVRAFDYLFPKHILLFLVAISPIMVKLKNSFIGVGGRRMK